MLLKYREELTRPIQEAMDFLKRIESQLNSISNGAATRFLSNGTHKHSFINYSFIHSFVLRFCFYI